MTSSAATCRLLLALLPLLAALCICRADQLGEPTSGSNHHQQQQLDTEIEEDDDDDVFGPDGDIMDPQDTLSRRFGDLDVLQDGIPDAVNEKTNNPCATKTDKAACQSCCTLKNQSGAVKRSKWGRRVCHCAERIQPLLFHAHTHLNHQ